jgi:hypothetical protein
VEAVRLGVPFDIAVFADTGSERPETYAFIGEFSDWLHAATGIVLDVVRWVRVRDSKDAKGRPVAKAGEFLSLHEWCERLGTLPSRSFGLSGCTSKWKQQPVDTFLLAHPLVKAEHAAGRQVERWIGYDADEPSRSERMIKKNPQADLWRWRTPLVEWDMGRAECVESIKRAGLAQPGKSACWFCPSSTKADIDQLGREHPDLLERALLMERTAIASGNVQSRGGLGGRLNWSDYREGKASEIALPLEFSCGCFDG